MSVRVLHKNVASTSVSADVENALKMSKTHDRYCTMLPADVFQLLQPKFNQLQTELKKVGLFPSFFYGTTLQGDSHQLIIDAKLHGEHATVSKNAHQWLWISIFVLQTMQ